MKKALVILFALCMVGAAFAADVAPVVTADATAVWGFDVETGATGFTNEANLNVVVPFFAGASAATKAGEGTYGELTVSGLNLSVYYDNDAGTETNGVHDNMDGDGFYDTISAKIVSGPMYVQIYDQPDFSWNNATVMGPLSIDAWEDASISTASAATKTTGGLTFGYTSDMVSGSLMVASNGGYDAGVDNNKDSEYSLGASVTVVPVADVVSVTGSFFMDSWKDSNKGVSLTASITPMAALALTVAFDGSIVAANDMQWDSSLGATYTLGNSDALEFSAFYSPAESYPTATSVNAYFETGVKFTEDGAAGFVPALGASVYFKGYNLMNATDDQTHEGLPAYLGASVDYTYALAEGQTLKPYASFDYGLLHSKGVTSDNGLVFAVGVEASVISNTTITAEFSGGAIADDGSAVTPLGVITPYGETGGKGVFTLTCTITL